MDPRDHADSSSSLVESDDIEFDDVSLSRKKKHQTADLDVVSILIALGLGAAFVWFPFFRAQ